MGVWSVDEHGEVMRFEREIPKQEDGYWWATSLRLEDDGEPEIIDVYGQGATRMSDSWPYQVGEFLLLERVDTSRWPQKGKRTEEELPDENYEVDPVTIHEGYWWAISFEDLQPLVVRVGKDKAVQDFNGDIEQSLNQFEFLVSIDTSGWPKE
jgi:hypothetical protein